MLTYSLRLRNCTGRANRAIRANRANCTKENSRPMPSVIALRVRVLMLAAAALISAAPLAAQGTRPVQSVDTLLAARDLAGAVRVVEAASTATPRDYDVLWRLSRVRVLQGDAEAEGSRAQDRRYGEALEAAERAVKARPDAPEGYVRRAAAMGKVALFAGILDAADYVTQVRDDTERVLAMQAVPVESRASAHYILGRAHLKLTETPRPLRMPIGLGFGNLDDAVRHLGEAVKLRADFVMFRLDYARALIKAKRNADARRELEAVATAPLQEVGDDVRKREAAELLAGLS